MSDIYHDGQRRLQDRFDTRRLADRLDGRIVHDRITDSDRRFIERLDMFFLATADAEGRPNCSYKGGDPGFVRVLDEHSLVFPNWDGNGMYLSAGNLLTNPHVGMLFIDFERQNRLRLNGIASIDERDALLGDYPRRPARGACACPRGLPQLPALHPQAPTRRGVGVRASARLHAASARLEAQRPCARCPARQRPPRD
jgi:hypothetical protein